MLSVDDLYSVDGKMCMKCISFDANAIFHHRTTQSLCEFVAENVCRVSSYSELNPMATEDSI